MAEHSLKKKSEKVFVRSASLHPIFPDTAREQMSQLVEIIAKSNKNINDILSTGQSAAVKGGFIAEEFHAETFNLDAALKGDSARAYTDRCPEWSQHQWHGDSLGKNDVPDIIVSRNGEVSRSAQSKYNYSPEETARQMSQVKDGSPKYEKVDLLLGPADQLDPAGDAVSVQEHAAAKAEALKSCGGDPAEISACEQTVSKSSAVLKDGKSSSSALSKDEANLLGSGNKDHLQDIESQYQTASTWKQMGNAAAGAAAMSAVVCGSVNTVRYLQLAREGSLTAEEATLKILGETVAAAADSAVKASANAGVQSLMVRYGSEKAVTEALAKQGLNTMLKSCGVTAAVSCTVDAVKDLVRLGMGHISGEEFLDRQGKGVLATSAGAVGGVAGASGATAAALSWGVASGSTAMTVIGLAGGLAGGIIAGLAMTLAIENGIERPYRDLVRNTENLKAAAAELEKLSRRMAEGQMLFTRFLQANQELDAALQEQFTRIDRAGAQALDIINKI